MMPEHATWRCHLSLGTGNPNHGVVAPTAADAWASPNTDVGCGERQFFCSCSYISCRTSDKDRRRHARIVIMLLRCNCRQWVVIFQALPRQ